MSTEIAGSPAAIAAFTDGVDVLELGVAVGMVRPLAGLAVGLAAVAQLAQQPADQLLADCEALLGQRPAMLTLAAADPAQRRLRVAADGILDQRLRAPRQPRLRVDRALAPAARASDARADRIAPRLQLGDGRD